ncbi:MULTISPECIES: prephenate dehydratase [Dehalococcoides]|uniref:Prephenate dehydratase n=1 Tax=Dehalococcoides mccartyi (strain VS) TaxID=311424 RepID=D2BJN6_DEHMV|nr:MULTISPECIES: prephenate dehydratase [Dehalococcoides]ACZ62536.1 prephenate dehydratase [Dehalococcoides mccartyi VS]AHB14213.1 prephenate dehydratase [Dehalococcoides mccartyi GY50]AII58563.1 prephenate dehydratase [Dehalococcoides mccartyi CG1]APH11683.1 prephenate dehydratase [Dehalococcoides mccartyi]OBW62742.1 MAG: prephenate dehydratase [Dehalococcoides mccartyi]
MIKISIQGARGSFHDIVARHKFPGDSEIIESNTSHQVFEDVKKGLADYGVVAIENSLYGSFLENYDNLLNYESKIVGETYLHVILNLIALPGVKMEQIREVYTHPIAMIQAESFLEKHPSVIRIESHDTAGSVRMIKEKSLKTAAAIGSNLAAQLYDMKILAKDIETEKQNYTRFLIIAKEPKYPPQANKTSLAIKAENNAGSLYKCLKCFYDQGINLSKIESRPIMGRTWGYYFYLDFERGLNTPETQRALKELEKVTESIHILGSYEQGKVFEE